MQKREYPLEMASMLGRTMSLSFASWMYVATWTLSDNLDDDGTLNAALRCGTSSWGHMQAPPWVSVIGH